MRWPVEVRRSLEFADFFLNTAAPLGALLLPWMLPEAFKLPWNAVTVPPLFHVLQHRPVQKHRS